ncbi:ArnT family glycosyltransferase [Lutibacter flavus]|uniref:Dolichyl-phosphate-mannose-protein mannosyltransferase n=1 Tax=Lutibacter flavus TaxID=691689 RepID=A0A238Z376_9FLAO|nr:glycosyltransferase family 39 protein [Lutibacter flavus]SNR77303.1 Dolichyl-phosphate-mannose-protein mannosyltransferase [Lutibacter flavus]
MFLFKQITNDNKFNQSITLNYGWKQIVLLYIVVSALRILFAVSGGIDLDPEESQYWLWSKHLDWSYYSKPPLIAYINGFTSSIFGSYTWTVKLNAVIIGSIIGLTTYYIVEQLYRSKKMAFFVSSGLLILPAYHYISMFFTTDVLVSFFWLLTCYFFWMATQKNSLTFWILTGLSIGIGFLAKYSLLFFIPFSFIYLLFKRKELLKQQGYYISILIATIFFTPVLIWNINHDMVGVFHISNLSGIGRKFISLNKSIIYLLEFFGGQLLLNLPFLFLFFYWKKYKIGSYLKGGFEQFIIFLITFVFITFTCISLIKRVQINWLIFSYIPFYIILLKAILKSGILLNKVVKKYIAFSSILLLLLLLQPVFETFTPHFSKLIPAKIDPFGKLVDWKGLANFVDVEINNKCDGKDYIILSDKYQIASQLTFYSTGHPKTYCLPYSGRRMNQFDIWGIPYTEIKEKQVVLIKTSPLEFDADINSLIEQSSIIYSTKYNILYKEKLVKSYYIYLLNKMPQLSNSTEIFTSF